ncbi:uncharacterized protein LOC134030369 [Osmerus eperlanus]|uniref:uncharacterized protein LOC134030369 n=1 Tax=Osmerus eperlanus TaxID=29151 RepID=UPI002E12E0BC
MQRIARSKSEKTHLYKLSRNENNIDIYNLNMSVINTGVGRKCCFGSTPLLGKHKTIMLVGATGSGKTTLINAMINYILGVKQKDPVRFELVPKESDKSQAHSQTSEITAYQINHCKDFAIDFSLTIIDTPGFGDTRGIAKDKEIVDMVRKFFSAKDGISSIDAVGFVTQSALVRLTPTQKYIFDSILSIFGKDIEDNIVLLATFADGQVPHVLQAIQEANIPCARNKKGIPICLKFNNSALFASNDEAGTGDKAGTDDEAGTDDRDEVVSFNEMFWKMGTVSIKNLFHRLNCLEAQSLQLTKEVLSERKNLETTVEGLQNIIQVGLINLDKLKKTQEALENHREAAESNKNFKYNVDVPKIEKVPLKTGIHTTTCRNCNFTCHDNCVYSNDDDKMEARQVRKRRIIIISEIRRTSSGGGGYLMCFLSVHYRSRPCLQRSSFLRQWKRTSPANGHNRRTLT